MTALSRPDLSDIHPGDWVDRRLPLARRPYTRLARLDRPVGVWLTLFPCLAALVRASHGFPAFWQLIVFSLAAVITAHLAWQAWRIDLQRPELNFRLFQSNILTGVLLACTALIGTW